MAPVGHVIEKILRHLGLPIDLPLQHPRASRLPARVRDVGRLGYRVTSLGRGAPSTARKSAVMAEGPSAWRPLGLAGRSATLDRRFGHAVYRWLSEIFARRLGMWQCLMVWRRTLIDPLWWCHSP